MKNFNYVMDHILDQIFKIILNISSKHEKVTDNTPIRTYVNKIESRIIFKIKTGYYLNILTPQTMKLFRSTKNNFAKDKNGKNIPHLEITKVVLVYCNIVNNDYQHNPRTLYTFVPNTSFDQFLYISPKNIIFLKTFHSDFSYIEEWFTDQISKLVEIEDKISITLVIKKRVTCRVIQLSLGIEWVFAFC